MEALQRNDDFLPEYLEALRSIALSEKASTRERIDCLIYLINRSQGAPKAVTDLRVKSKIKFTADDYELATRIPQLEEQKLIEQYSHDSLSEKAGE